MEPVDGTKIPMDLPAELVQDKGATELLATMLELWNQKKILVEALEEITKGEGPFSHDRLTHASNTIENMKRIASEAIAKVKGE